ncbi:alcohol dehydrogenase [Ilyonectria sp. MPI-CAGE-AT-0026]|nr:alcohol dehydrogenase [Ilyonectria sp. MPI-CAGE-AT-0026]
MTKAGTPYRVAVVIRENGGFRFEIRQQILQKLGPHDVLLRLSASGICGTDIGLASGHAGPSREILGHEGVGYVVEIGSQVPADLVSIDDRVGVAWIRDICGKCQCCLLPGGETRCRRQKNSGRAVDGTFAEYAVVPTSYIIRLPKEIDLPDAIIAPMLCGGVTAYKALKEANVNAGQWVVVSGAGGGVGALATQFGRALGARVIAIDAGDAKRRFCLEQGAEAYIDYTSGSDLVKEVYRITKGLGASAAIVAATSSPAYESALQSLGVFGTLVSIGIPRAADFATYHPRVLIDKGIRVTGSGVGTRGDMLTALDFVQRKLVTPRIQIVRLEQLNEVVENFPQVTGKYVINLADSPQQARL